MLNRGHRMAAWLLPRELYPDRQERQGHLGELERWVVGKQVARTG